MLYSNIMNYLSFSKLSYLRRWLLVALTVIMLGLIVDGFHVHIDTVDVDACLVCQHRIDQDDKYFPAVLLPLSSYALQRTVPAVKTVVIPGLIRAVLSIRAPPVLLRT